MNDYREGGRDSYRGGSNGGGGGGRQGGGGRRPSNQNGQGDRMGERRGIPLSELDPTTTEASRKVIGCSIEVHRQLGPGYSAAIYETALKYELTQAGVTFEGSHKVPVTYKGATIGEVEACLFIDHLFFVCVTANPGAVTSAERATLRAQLKAANLDLGLIINFAERRLKDGLVRVLNVDKINAEKGLPHDGAHHDGVDDDLDHGQEHGSEFNQHA